MKSLVLFLLLISTAFKPPGENVTRTWVYVNSAVVADLTPYDTALAASDLDRLRYFDKRNTIVFDNGLKVELFSANEVTAMGMPVKTTHVRTKDPVFDSGSIFKLAANGMLVEVMTKKIGK